MVDIYNNDFTLLPNHCRCKGPKSNFTCYPVHNFLVVNDKYYMLTKWMKMV